MLKGKTKKIEQVQNKEKMGRREVTCDIKRVTKKAKKKRVSK